jgi:hypothetical protein
MLTNESESVKSDVFKFDVFQSVENSKSGEICLIASK